MDIYTLSIGKSALVSFLFSRGALFSSLAAGCFYPGTIESFAQGPYCTLEPLYRDDTFYRNVATIPAIHLVACEGDVCVILTQLYFKALLAVFMIPAISSAINTTTKLSLTPDR